MQSTLKVTSKGQVTLRRDLLAHLGIKPGDTLIVQASEPGRLVVHGAPNHAIEDFFGCLKREGQPVLTLEDMEAVIAKGWAGNL